MRPSYLRSYSPFISSNTNCLEPSIDYEQFVKYKCDDNSGSHSFRHCSWDNTGLTTNGGAIHYVLSEDTKQTSSISVYKCTFLHCHETSTDGGAVYARYIGSASVSDSFFYDCECGSDHGQEGGGICYAYLSSNPSISRCTFISCVSADDGGGCGIWYSHSPTPYAVDSCSFIQCNGINDAESEGGGIILCLNTDFITCINCLFYGCKGPSQGGGIFLEGASDTTPVPITFCFFRENESRNGRDVFLRGLPSNIRAITHSFSFESRDGRVAGGQDNWLPQGVIKYMNQTSTASNCGAAAKTGCIKLQTSITKAKTHARVEFATSPSKLTYNLDTDTIKPYRNGNNVYPLKISTTKSQGIDQLPDNDVKNVVFEIGSNFNSTNIYAFNPDEFSISLSCFFPSIFIKFAELLEKLTVGLIMLSQ